MISNETSTKLKRKIHCSRLGCTQVRPKLNMLDFLDIFGQLGKLGKLGKLGNLRAGVTTNTQHRDSFVMISFFYPSHPSQRKQIVNIFH